MNIEYGEAGEGRTALIPMSEAYNIVSKLDTDTIFSDHAAGIKFKRVAQNYYQLFINKGEHFDKYTDPKLRSLIKRAEGQSEDELADFVQNAGDMTAALHIDNLQAFLDRLTAFGVMYEGAAKELEDWEIENEEEWGEKTKSNNQTYWYKLSRPYGEGSNPTVGFVNYKEPTTEYPNGLILFKPKIRR